jgi:dTDP-glucose pyrophosphorylase/CBS domain-containing protein
MEIASIKIGLTTPLKEVILTIQQSGAAACALVFDGNIFVNLITDGDVRRALLEHESLDITAADIVSRKQRSDRSHTITASVDSSPDKYRFLFQTQNLRQLLIVDYRGEPVDVITHEDIKITPREIEADFVALIMAGGFGLRMRPLTNSVPKPMLPINGAPLMQLIVDRLVQSGVRKIYVSTHYLSEMIISHFGNGSKFGIEIEYLEEIFPLGTGGCLSLIKDRSRDVLVINGDILTELDLRMFYGNHYRAQADLSIATSIYSFQVPYGVVEAMEANVLGLKEKPVSRYLINSGIYVVSSTVLQSLPARQKFDVTDLIGQLISAGRRVVQFPIFEKWLDIGRLEDYQRAQET